MKIICFNPGARKDDRAELDYCFKADSVLLKKNRAFYIPNFSDDVRLFVQPVVKLHRLGKSIASKFASRYYQEVTAGISFVANDVLDKQIADGKPWDKAYSFDGANPIGKFVSIDDFLNDGAILRLKCNSEIVVEKDCTNIKNNVNEKIALVSECNTMKIGDLFYLPASHEGFSINIEDRFEVFLNDKLLLSVGIK